MAAPRPVPIMPETLSSPHAPAAPVGPSSMPLWSRVVGVITSPRATFEWVAAHPSWLPMLALTTCLTALAMGVFLSTEVGRQAYVDQTVSFMESWGRTVDDEGYAAIERQAAIAQYVNPATILLAFPLMTALIAVFVYGIFSALYGGTATYRQLLAIVAHSGAVGLVQQLFSMPLNYARQSLSSPTNLSVFFPMLEEGSFLNALLGSIDLFILWSLFAVAIGVGVVYKRPTRSAAVVLYVVYGIFIVGLALARTAFAGA